MFKPDYDTQSAFKDQPAHLLDTVVTTNLTKQQLYSNALDYVAKSFENSRAVIEMKDLELGEVLFVGRLKTTYLDTLEQVVKKKATTTVFERESFVEFKCKIYAKDEKFKIVLFSLKSPMLYFAKDILFTLRNEYYKPYNEAAKTTALSYIKETAAFLNRKPVSDF